MLMSRRVSLFLLAFGVWSWIIWLTFAYNLWNGDSARDAAGELTPLFYVHAVLALVSFVLGTIVGVIGLRGLRAKRRG